MTIYDKFKNFLRKTWLYYPLKKINSLLRPVRYIVKSIKNRIVLTNIDKQSPFQGLLKDKGFYVSRISSKSLKTLKDWYKKSSINPNGKHDISTKEFQTLNHDHYSFVKETFEILNPIVKNYLGKDAYLDGFNWYVTYKKVNSISNNWHVDNVGNRLKCFICVEGDGSQPTVIIPSKHRIQSFLSWIRIMYIESFRWAGFTKIDELKNQIKLAHEDGTISVFDTALLHRGKYEDGNTDRVVLILEFSKPQKHHLANGPIGTKDYNSFIFENEIMNIPQFEELIDKNRLQTFDKNKKSYGQIN